MTVRRPVRITNPLGMHARAAARFSRVASQFAAHVIVERDWRRVDGKSVLGLLLLSAAAGTEIVIEAEGPDADAAVAALARFVEAGFDEGPSPGHARTR